MRGQGALEYLIIIAAVLGITAVVVTFVTSAFTSASAGGDIAQCRLAAAQCKKDLTLGITQSCDYCINACTDPAGLDLLDSTPGGGLACAQCQEGEAIVIHEGAEQTIDLVGYWSFNAGTGTAVADESGTGNNGAFSGENFHNGVLYNGPTWTTGRYGGGIHFDGLNDHVGIPDAQNLKYRGGNLTLSAWIYQDAYETNSGWIISKPWNGNGEYNYGINAWGDGRIEFRIGGSTSHVMYSTAAISKNTWHYITATANSSGSMKIYIDGVERGSSVYGMASWVPVSGDSNLRVAIGTLYPYGEGWGGVNSYSFNGTIDAVRILNRTLTQTEIQAEMASSRPVIRPMVSMEMEDASGTTARDTHIWVTGRSGAAMSFDGVDDYVEIPSSLSLSITDKITLSFWFKFDKNVVTSSASTMIRKNPQDWLSEPSAGSVISWYITNASGSAAGVATGVVQNNRWYHIVGTYNSSLLRVYLDGAAVSSVPLYGPIRTNNSYMRMGNWLTEKYWGYLDEVHIYNRILSQAEITALYNV